MITKTADDFTKEAIFGFGGVEFGPSRGGSFTPKPLKGPKVTGEPSWLRKTVASGVGDAKKWLDKKLDNTSERIREKLNIKKEDPKPRVSKHQATRSALRNKLLRRAGVAGLIGMGGSALLADRSSDNKVDKLRALPDSVRYDLFRDENLDQLSAADKYRVINDPDALKSLAKRDYNQGAIGGVLGAGTGFVSSLDKVLQGSKGGISKSKLVRRPLALAALGTVGGNYLSNRSLSRQVDNTRDRQSVDNFVNRMEM